MSYQASWPPAKNVAGRECQLPTSFSDRHQAVTAIGQLALGLERIGGSFQERVGVAKTLEPTRNHLIGTGLNSPNTLPTIRRSWQVLLTLDFFSRRANLLAGAKGSLGCASAAIGQRGPAFWRAGWQRGKRGQKFRQSEEQSGKIGQNPEKPGGRKSGRHTDGGMAGKGWWGIVKSCMQIGYGV